MRNTKQAFTLVELIVVITILAILGTIAFISLQGYSAEARNAKRTSDLSSIASSLSVKLTNGMSVLSAVGNSDNRNTSISLAGSGTVGTTYYNAGDINYTALEMKTEEFQDPDGDSYAIGATTLDGAVYQLAATVESDGSDAALVTGMYVARNTGSIVTWSLTWNVFRLDSITNTGKFKFNDTIDLSTTGWTDITITKISSDWMNITVSGSPTSWTWINMTLNLDESAGLIGDHNSTTAALVTTAVTDGSTTALPY